MATDFSHLDALEVRRDREGQRLATAATAKERALRQIWVAQIEREIAAEKQFLGLDEYEMTDDELLAALAE